MEERNDQHRESAQPESPQSANRPPQNRMIFDGPKLTFKRLPRVGDTLTLNGRTIGFCRPAQLGHGKSIDFDCAIQGNEFAQAAALAALINKHRDHFKMTAVHERRSVIVTVHAPEGSAYPEELVSALEPA